MQRHNKIQLTRVKTWAELYTHLFPKEAVVHGRFRSNEAFRGVGRVSFDLKTSLIRLTSDPARVEGPMRRAFRKYAHRAFSENQDWNWLSLAQHHGLPTRLLDWTLSPYVAMHFATQDMSLMNQDGAIWCVDFVKIHELLPPKLCQALKTEDAYLFNIDLLERTAVNVQAFDALGKGEFAVFFEPPSLDDRIVNQYALFSVMPSPTARLDNWLMTNHPDFMRKVIIPASLKWEIRDKLDQANITERMLFPGLDGLSTWLTRHYSGGPMNARNQKKA